MRTFVFNVEDDENGSSYLYEFVEFYLMKESTERTASEKGGSRRRNIF